MGRNFKHLPLFSLSIDKSPSGMFESDQIDGVKRVALQTFSLSPANNIFVVGIQLDDLEYFDLLAAMAPTVSDFRHSVLQLREQQRVGAP